MNPEKGGVSQAVRNIICQNQFAEHAVVCFDSETEAYSIEDRFKTYKIGFGKTGFQYQPTFVTWLTKHAGEYDCVTVHGIWQYHNYAVYRAFSSMKKKGKDRIPKVAIMPHGMLDPYFQRDPTRKLKAMRNEILWRITEKKAINAADTLLFTCEEELRLAKTTFRGYKPKKELNVGLGVAHPPFFKQIMKLAFNKTVQLNQAYLLFLSRIHPKKGIDLLIDAYKKLYRTHENIPDLVIAGPLDSLYAQEMRDLAADCPRIFFTGMLMGNAKWGAFYGAEAFVLPSHQENFGIAVVEALACSKAVLITNKVNIWREIEIGNGGIVKSDTENGIYNLLKDWIFLSDVEKRNKSTSAKKVYQNTFTIEKSAKQFLKGTTNL